MSRKNSRIIRDPRPDLAFDSQEWSALLTDVETSDKELAGILHGFRCAGLRLHRGGKGYVLRPEYEPRKSKWANADEYKADTDKWLRPHIKQIVSALQTLTEGGGQVA